MTPFRYQDDLTVGRLLQFFRLRERLRCRSQLVRPGFEEVQVPPHAVRRSVPTSKPIAPEGVWVADNLVPFGERSTRSWGRSVARLWRRSGRAPRAAPPPEPTA